MFIKFKKDHVVNTEKVELVWQSKDKDDENLKFSIQTDIFVVEPEFIPEFLKALSLDGLL